MYRIAICDDEMIFRRSLSDITRRILESLHIPCQLDEYSNGKELLEVVCGQPDAYHLLLLDILMEGMNGMELARHIRQRDSSAVIVFITSTPDFSLQGYEVRAFHYLLKPVSETKLKDILTNVYQNTVQQEVLVIREKTRIRKFYSKQVNYLETKGRKVAVYLASETIMVSTKLSELESQLPGNRFIRCHQSFIINLDQMSELHGSEAVLKNGKSVPVSRIHMKNVQSAFLKLLGELSF